MKYTVIQKSGWQSDNWKVASTFNSEADARNYVDENATADARSDFYNTAIKAHRKPLAQMMDRNYGGMVKFSDGTRAIW